MSKDEALRDLIERVGRAEGPDRIIDGMIWAFIKGDDPYIIGNQPGRFPQKPIYGTRADVMRETPSKDGADYIGAPLFTASIDAAMTLVPEGCMWLRLSPETMTVSRPDPNEKRWAKHFDGKGATPALALCCASLRAHMGTGG